MIEYLGLFGMSCVSAYIFRGFLETLYERKYSRKIYYECAFTAYILVSFAASAVKLPIINVLCTVLVMGFINAFMYDGEGRNRVVSFALYFLYIVAVDAIVSVAFSAAAFQANYVTLEHGALYLLSGVVNAIVLICTHKMAIGCLERNKVSASSIALNIYMVFLLGFEVSVISYLVSIHFRSVPFLLICTGFVGIDIGSLQLYFLTSRNAYLTQQTLLFEQQKMAAKRYYQGVQKRYDDTQQILHDFKKHIRVLARLTDEEQDRKMCYANDLLDKIEKLEPEFRCRNRILQVLIWDYMHRCSQSGIIFHIDMEDIGFEFMSDIEVTALFANLLDNAVEACTRDGEDGGRIEVKIGRFQDYIIIRIRNTITDSPAVKKGRLISSKQGHSGLGMEIAREIAKRYNGCLEFEYSENFFDVKVNFVSQ